MKLLLIYSRQTLVPVLEAEANAPALVTGVLYFAFKWWVLGCVTDELSLVFVLNINTAEPGVINPCNCVPLK